MKHQFKSYTESYVQDIISTLQQGSHYPYFVTTTFYDIIRTPTDKESELLNYAKNYKKCDYDSFLYCATQLRNERENTNKWKGKVVYQGGLTERRVDNVWKAYDKFMAFLLPALIPNHNRQCRLPLHPLTIDFIDAAGSKHHNSVVDGDNSLHIHSVFLVHESTKEKFEQLVNQGFTPLLWHNDLSLIRDVYVKPIGLTRSDIWNVVQYGSKFIRHVGQFTYPNLDLSFHHPISSEDRVEKYLRAKELHGIDRYAVGCQKVFGGQ